MTMNLTEEQILEYLKSSRAPALPLKTMMRHFGVSSTERHQFRRLLKRLTQRGLVRRVRGNRYAVEEVDRRGTGTLRMERDGTGLVDLDGRRGTRVLIPSGALGTAAHGDKVTVEFDPDTLPLRGRVVDIVFRGPAQLVGRLVGERRRHYLIPHEEGWQGEVPVSGDLMGAEPGDLVLARVESHAAYRRVYRARVLRVFGSFEDARLDFEDICYKHKLPVEFTPETLAEADAVSPAVTPQETIGRTDLRGEFLVTIDGEDARDFDDAVGVEELPGGGFLLRVAIADVSHYVAVGSSIDADAYRRTTSVYFPMKALPMLPPALSSGICSLRPGEDRLVMAVDLTLDAEGALRSARFYRGVMRSRARLTYTRVWAILQGEGERPDEPEGLAARLRLMERLARLMVERRRRRGGLDFDLPEPAFDLDEEERPLGVARAERNFSHRLIEEFMVQANEATALFLEAESDGAIYRIHEEPDPADLGELADLARVLGVNTDAASLGDPREMQRILEESAGSPMERGLQLSVLRSLKLAQYAEHNPGHFGLALRHYPHFTSPIRRYPDLQVHRLLGRALERGRAEITVEGDQGDKRPKRRGRSGRPVRGSRRLSSGADAIAPEPLKDVAHLSSEYERRAMKAERDMADLKRARLIAGHLGETFAGTISGVAEHGFYVELDDHFLEGLVPVRTLADDYYQLEPFALVGRETGRRFELGRRVRVTVDQVDLDHRYINFSLAGENEGRARAGRRPKRPRNAGKPPRRRRVHF